MTTTDLPCRAVIDATRCAHPAAYRTTLADCDHCHTRGYLWCAGHSACVRHAAELRTGTLLFTAGRPVVVARILQTPALEVAHA
ncbi:MAG: hypothetical protein JWO11_2676 [Nocardioides sp.]|nr:hypothetical protein [Nocardioides sp.]